MSPGAPRARRSQVGGAGLDATIGARRVLRTFSALAAVDEAFRLYGEHRGVLFVSSLIGAVPAALGWLAIDAVAGSARLPLIQMSSAEPGEIAAPLPFATFFAFGAAALLLSTVTATVGVAAASTVTAALARGQQPTLAAAVAATSRAGLPLAAASALVAVLTAAGLGLALVPGVVALVACAFVGPALVLERRGPIAAVQRSWRLSRGRRMKIATTFLLCGLVIASATSALATLGTIAGVLGDSAAERIATALLTQVVAAGGTPVLYVALALLYFDARVAGEALDVQVLATGTLATGTTTTVTLATGTIATGTMASATPAVDMPPAAGGASDTWPTHTRATGVPPAGAPAGYRREME